MVVYVNRITQLAARCNWRARLRVLKSHKLAEYWPKISRHKYTPHQQAQADEIARLTRERFVVAARREYLIGDHVQQITRGLKTL